MYRRQIFNAVGNRNRNVYRSIYRCKFNVFVLLQQRGITSHSNATLRLFDDGQPQGLSLQFSAETFNQCCRERSKCVAFTCDYL